MTKSDYNQQIETLFNFFNSVYFQSLTAGYTLLFAGEFKDLRNELDEDDELKLEPELLILSKDKIVQILGEFCKELEPKIEKLANLNNLQVAVGADFLEEMHEDPTFVAERNSFKNQDYTKVFMKCAGTLLEFSFDMASIMEVFICDVAGVKPTKADPMSPMSAKIESLRPHCDTNTHLLLDMTLSLKNAVGGLMNEGTNNGLLKGISIGDLLAKANEPD